MKIAWFTPLALRSAIGDYSEVIATALASADDVTLYYPDSPEHGPPRPAAIPCVPIPALPDDRFLASLSAHDIHVYNIGNFLDFHLPIYRTALRKPGIVVLHDIVMRDFFSEYFARLRDGAGGYGQFLRKAHGADAERAAAEVHAGRAHETPDERLRHPLFRPTLTGALGAIVHSEYARQRVAAEVSVAVRTIDFPIFGPSRSYVDTDPVRTPCPHGKVRLLSFGMLNRNRLIPETIAAIAESEYLRRHCTFDLIGQGPKNLEATLRTSIERHGLGDTVRLHGWQPEEKLQEALLASDVVINLRNPHSGESSCVLSTSLLAGLPTMVWDHGFYAEFPDEVAVKLSSVAEIGPALERLVRDAELRAAYGTSARVHALERFSTERYCRSFREFAEEVLRQKPMLMLADRVTDILQEMGPSHGHREFIGRIGVIIAGFASPPCSAGGQRPTAKV